MGVKLHYTQQRALDKLGYTFEDFFVELERLTYVEKVPLCDICKMFPQVSDTFIRNFEGWIDFIYLTPEQNYERIRQTYNNPEKRKKILQKISNSLVGKKRTKEQRLKMSESAKSRGISKETQRKMRESLRAVYDSERWKEQQSRNMKMYFNCLSTKQKQEKLKHFINSSVRNSNTSIERKVEIQLKQIGVKYIKQKRIFDGSKNYILDFYLPDIRTAIECNGDYWHNLPERRERDKRLKEFGKRTNHKIIFIWEHEINDEWFWVGDFLEDDWEEEDE